ncbi:P-loop NTPase family protein [Halanaeroarchaeum sulfurireducens]|uniref:hypothetical protein n=1 Tax=Halanaeroarchaeum sulfurireducens TaxID=1604004 RepID=UPI0006799741|nr:hypothetical protein [Halanaeroarchaeum sulfurireducens]
MSRSASQSTPLPELPRLSPGVWLLETTGHDLASLHTLVVDHLLLGDGSAVWIDAGERGRSQLLREIAPDPRVLDRIRIARGFTAFQHAALVETAADVVDGTVGLVVAPAVDFPYRDEEGRGVAPRKLLLRTIARLARFARDQSIPVLLTRTGANGLGKPVASVAGDTITVERTRFGPRFESDAFETLVYPARRGHAQTTLAFWRRVLAARQPLYASAPGSTDPSPGSREGVLSDGAH